MKDGYGIMLIGSMTVALLLVFLYDAPVANALIAASLISINFSLWIREDK